MLTVSSTALSSNSSPLSPAKNSSSSNESLFEDKLFLDVNKPSNSNPADAVTINIQSFDREDDLNQKFLEATKFLKTALKATEDVESILDNVSKISNEMASSASATRQDALGSEAISFVEEIDSVVTQATGTNGVSVVDQGAQSFLVDLDSSDGSSATNFAVLAPNVPISRESLGIADLTADDFKNDLDGTQDLINAAKLEVSSTKAAISSSLSQIEASLSTVGIQEDVQQNAEQIFSFQSFADVSASVQPIVDSTLESQGVNISTINTKEFLAPLSDLLAD